MMVEDLVYRYALMNAVKHKGKANPGAVMGAVMSNEPELRKRAPEVKEAVQAAVEKVNSLKPEEQQSEMERLGLEIRERKQKKRQGLRNLPDVKGEVVLRFAPNPSGPLHIGHARAAILNHEYARRYDGKLILRIEDTDPRRVDPEAYDMIPSDLEWLGVEWDETIIQSDRMEIYYEYTERLIERGGAYVCTCTPEAFREFKNEGKACHCRDLGVRENLQRWREMFEMPEGSAVVRVKTDLQHPNPAIRDWVSMRIVEAEHPRTGTRYRVYPMMNFSVAVDDHLLGVTHVLRGKDHLANSEKQEYLYRHLGWEPPVFIHYGRLKMDDIALSTSGAREGIVEGKYSGWDDPRLGTIRAIARRGIRSDAIRKLMVEIGVKIADSTMSWKKIYGLNRNILEEEARRYFFAADPVRFEIEGLPGPIRVERSLHPDKPELGNRILELNGDVYLPRGDLREGPLRLIDAVNVIYSDGELRYHSEGIEEARELQAAMIHWVPAESALKAVVVMPDASEIEGVIEGDASELEVDDVVQLERFGFARVDSSGERLVFYYAHK
ncbi:MULTISPECIES: glutamate--tRNA ligase [Methanothermobacter]|uniref:Glutamate--tRNA ligase n=1 Tax=Methanothermobacter marburgensis (strain ATCC BAA-927 / DSM 2133 / JCM 14651 / NBRC 100331 / OCM 82 / Marburg) TaxID=79929 RepID=SYE_METTM|nr:RecName: Full=Glutamate--tRNA ligase; AltName: Full=Glutamyl-tRNA synthetase; Short=GluRS [Methanothermobacter marburgensis str. Marburg]pir/S65787/ glutamate-tRNA ligase (EC 6.1.1.17) [validated] - Methanobacterium thermoautotrophicum (strain Marburg) [Methanothermobacter thermautotrophicus]AAC43972.1 glutamyl-tRNA synthetase [Methanothermobacter thermautotrophicus]ADL58135.1 glutamyl-tRNA synthetase [Methanothermobacter marburgensis str. Marburg]prf//2207186A Glu-tRNA synthetase [Methanoth